MTDLVKNSPKWTDDDLKSIKSFDDLLAFAQHPDVSDHIVIADVETYGLGFDLVEDKNDLIGKHFVILEYKFNAGKYAEDFVSMMIITKDGRKLILNDGSTGIREQMKMIDKTAQAEGAMVAINVRKGLRVSNYTYVDDKGKETPASTFYLAI